MKRKFNLIILGLVIFLSMFTTSCSASPYGRFERVSDMNIARGNPTLFLLKDGRVLVFGEDAYHRKTSYGTIQHGTNDNISAEIFDPKTNTFTLKKGLNHGLWGFTTTLLHDDKVLITGGQIKNTREICNTSEIYDPKTDTVTKGTDMHSTRYYHTAVPLKDGRVLIFGGATINETDNKTAEIYDPVQNKFILLKDAPAEVPVGFNGTQVLNDGTVCILNRHGSYEKYSKDIVFHVETFDPKTNEFRTIKYEKQPKSKGVSTFRCRQTVKLKDDRIVLLGEKSSFENEVDIYDYKKNEMQVIGHLNNKKLTSHYRMTLLSDGNVLITDGAVPTFESCKVLNTAEIFNTTTLKFSNLPKMTTEGGSTILLDDGRVLKVSGDSFSPWENKNSEKLAEVFIPNKK